ncbi:Interferon-induced transmembrane protein [Aquimarina amphilecti]|uniref:Interferon-induced transmembrane protein n=1 Tax=Aquimarina amphilecti TaxID=1038014 RepID=A0A1H7F9C7_AQUAM|nr:CD225/dispanin family protein [Aquimarina amphilecti]SEK22743.1 Interferon-induced transmembrane protein [Aquimarina amphilecti]
MEANQPRPNNHLALAIISTILCCLITGIVSIIYSTQVNSKYDAGDYEGAVAASKNAKLWGLIGIGMGVVIAIAYFAFFGIAIFSGLASGNNF